MRHLLVALVGTLPTSTFKNYLLRILGWEIGRSTEIGPGLYLRLTVVKLGDHVRIGPFNVFRDMAEVRLGARARIGQWNWISSALPLVEARGGGYLRLDNDAAITARHYLDCSGGVSIGHHTTVAGVRSTFITHGIEWRSAAQTSSSIVIGDYCIISSNVALTPGTVVESRCVVGMGAVAARTVGPEGTLQVGSRVTAVKSGLEGLYFTRYKGYIRDIKARD